MNTFQIIYVTKSSSIDELTERVLEDFPSCKKKVVSDDYDFSEQHELLAPKRVLFLKRSKGKVVKDCPGTAENYLCCRYRVINQAQNCPLNCTYCILQFYLNQPAMIIFTDVDDILTEAKSKIQAHPERLFRIGTGELGDSLALSGSRYFAEKAIPFFASLPNVVFELKSKTTKIDSLLSLKHQGRTVLSWSVNPQKIIESEESKSASLSARLAAAKKAQEAGFLIGFHFDPILYVADWKNKYTDLIEEVYQKVDSSRIAWISLGSLRFPLSMKDRISKRCPESDIPFGEMVRGMDGKLRYTRPVRVPMYQLVYNRLMAFPNPSFVYFCMESPVVWREVTGFTPESNKHLDFLFAESLFRRFPELSFPRPERSKYDKDVVF